MSWGPGELERISAEPYDLRSHLQELDASMLKRGSAERGRAAVQYNATVRSMSFPVGERVLVWAPDLAALEGRKIAPPWIGPYRVQKKLSLRIYLLMWEKGARLARVHANRLRRISQANQKTADPNNGVFSDSLRLIRKIQGVKDAVSDDGTRTRLFKVRIGGRSSPHGHRKRIFRRLFLLLGTWLQLLLKTNPKSTQDNAQYHAPSSMLLSEAEQI